MGRAAELLGVTQGFLRSLGEAKLIEPLRPLPLLPLGPTRPRTRRRSTALDAACRIIILEDQLAEALRINRQIEEKASP